jgi:hypothetical protein
LCKTHCLFDTDYTNLLTRWADEANLWHANALIDTWVADLYSFLDVTLAATPMATPATGAARAQKRSFQELYPNT